MELAPDRELWDERCVVQEARGMEETKWVTKGTTQCIRCMDAKSFMSSTYKKG